MSEKEIRMKLYQMLKLKQELELPEIPDMPGSLKKQLSQSVKHYFDSDIDHQRLARLTTSLRGKTDRYVFQMSNGSQQIKLYEPHKYKNDKTTPLRLRSRMIMNLAHQTPSADVKKKVQELHKTYPYHLLQDQPVNLRLLNFRFDREPLQTDVLDIYKTTSAGEPDPENDTLIDTVVYKPKKSRKFEFDGEEEQFFYAVNTRNNSVSNVLHFLWQTELPQIPSAT